MTCEPAGVLSAGEDRERQKTERETKVNHTSSTEEKSEFLKVLREAREPLTGIPPTIGMRL